MTYEFTTKAAVNIKIDGVPYEIWQIKSGDIMKGGFLYECSKKHMKENRLLRARLVREQERLERSGTAEIVDGMNEDDIMLEGESGRIVIMYQIEIVKHYSTIPAKVVGELPVPVLARLAHYIETGTIEDEPTAKNAVEAVPSTTAVPQFDQEN